jgi:hypothetical protein
LFSDARPHSKDGLRFFRVASLPLSIAILILVGVLLTLLGLLLFPVNLGIILFSPDGQLGLLMVIVAIQMMAIGETPLGQYKRSLLLSTDIATGEPSPHHTLVSMLRLL